MTLNNVPYLRVSSVTVVPQLMVRVMLILYGYLRPYVHACMYLHQHLYVHSLICTYIHDPNRLGDAVDAIMTAANICQ